jgi:hypothetical protein
MIDAVNTVSVQSAAVRVSSAPASAPAAATVSSVPGDIPVYRVRIDDQSNRLLLETVSTTGQVVNQWPTPAQLEAFIDAQQIAQQAAAAQADQNAQQYQQLAEGTTPGAGSADNTGGASSGSPPPSAPAPQAVPTTSFTYGSNAAPTGGSQGSSTQSVVA